MGPFTMPAPERGPNGSGTSWRMRQEVPVTAKHGTETGRTSGARHQRRLAWTLALTGTFLVVEVAGGLWTGSLALLADAGHMLADVGAIAPSFLAVRFAQRPPSPLHTYANRHLGV